MPIHHSFPILHRPSFTLNFHENKIYIMWMRSGHYSVISVCPISMTMISSSIHVVNDRSPFLQWLCAFHCQCILCFPNPFIWCWALSSFHFLTLVNSHKVNGIAADLSTSKFQLFEQCPIVGLLGHEEVQLWLLLLRFKDSLFYDLQCLC